MMSLFNAGSLALVSIVIDKECGGYYTNVSKDWASFPEQEKMIVSQARHVWTASKAAAFLPKRGFYEEVGLHGFGSSAMSCGTATHGGFYQIRGRSGRADGEQGVERREDGLMASLRHLRPCGIVCADGEAEVLALAQRGYQLDRRTRLRSRLQGIFRISDEEGTTVRMDDPYMSRSRRMPTKLDIKDQNSSIHLLEAYTELYAVWKDDASSHTTGGDPEVDPGYDGPSQGISSAVFPSRTGVPRLVP